jgi:KDO2-lipid IV(A) lauroyltransferase
VIQFIGLWLLVRVFAVLPTRVLYAAAWLAGTALWYASPRVRATTRNHMRHVLGDATPRGERDRAARGCARSALYYFVDFAKYARMDPNQVFDHVDQATGIGEALHAHDRGCGMLLLSAHLGNPEFIVQALGEFSLDLAVITEPLEPPQMHELIHRIRTRTGVKFFPADLSGVRQSIKHLRQGGTLAIVTDRDIQGGATPRPFFGAPAPVPAGVIELARRTGAPITAGSVARTAPGRFRIDLEQLELPEATGDRATDLESGMQAMIAFLERSIRCWPDQWFALSPIWPVADAPNDKELT